MLLNNYVLKIIRAYQNNISIFLWSKTYDVLLKSSALIRFYPLVLIKGSTVFMERSVYCIPRAKWLNEYFWKILYDNTCVYRRACITPKALNLLHAFPRRRQAKEKIHRTVGCRLCLAVTMECWRHMIRSVTRFKDNSTVYFCERGAAFPYFEELVIAWLATLSIFTIIITYNLDQIRQARYICQIHQFVDDIDGFGF